jgi:cell division protein ZapE
MPAKKQAKTDTLEAHYERLVAQGIIKNDEAQRGVLAALQELQAGLAARGGFFKKQSVTPHGLYIWGNVGRGKSMLMDLFFKDVPVEKKRRIHFLTFMQETHARIHQLRQKMQSDPVATLAHQMAEETTLLCFDELQANDVADATLLYRLFSGLFDAGVTIVSTSNHPPQTLYTGGVQRERFAKFISLIEERMRVMALSSPDDYRQMQIKSLDKTWFSPLGPSADGFIENTISHLAHNPTPGRGTLAVQGREIPFALYNDNIGRFSFHELCETPLGPADYLAIATRLTTIIITGIPVLTPEKRNEARRFITLIDALYENKVKLIATAAAAPEQLYPEGDGAFEFKRTVSRLVEMQSEKWLTNY